MPHLFDSIRIGALPLNNRIVMAPLTRSRAGTSRTANELMAKYYAQRASAGLIVSEATAISREGYGWMNAPGMYTDDQEKGWQLVTRAVHDAGGSIVLQLWHLGRLSHPDFLDGDLPLAPSAIAPPGVARGTGGKKPYVTPRAMTKDEIGRTIEDYAHAARRAIRAGFDGVEIHGANGYLIDQFLRDGTNTRTDEYGGGIEGRTRFLRETVDAVIAEAGAERTGLRISPNNNAPGNPVGDSDLAGLFTRVAQDMDRARIAFLHVREIWRDETGARPLAITPVIRRAYHGVLIANDAYDLESGNAVLQKGLADAVAFGRPFIANPDLVERWHVGVSLNPPDTDTFYTGHEAGYTDYPSMVAAPV